MAYTINGKVYTEHPLMDEMIYNLDIIMNGIEIKNEETALELESEDSLKQSETYMTIMGGYMSFDLFPFTKELLSAYGYNEAQCISYVADKNLIPVEDREELYEFVVDKFISDYEEQNNYYRALIGLPWIDKEEEPELYYVYIDESYISEPLLVDVFDFNLPLHEYSNYQIAVLIALGAMDTIYAEYSGKYYKYLHFLGDSKRDLYEVRSAAKWDILYMPSVETLVKDRFEQLYQINRDLFLHRFYSDAYKIMSDYYEEFMIILLLCQTYTDMIADIPEWYVRRDVFDLRSCQYFLESHGIEFFKEIPLKYQIRIVKNINKLIRYKSTNKNIWDIIDLFTTDSVTVYKYYIFKKRIANEQGSYATGKDPADEYELEFVKAPIGESYDDYIKNNIYREPYDDITYQDKWWDGEDIHENVKALHLAKDFTIEGTKFISLENRISMSEYTYQVEYFMGLLLDSTMEISDIKINIPTISNIISFSLSDLFILLYCMTGLYDDYSINIRTPINMRTKEKPEFVKYNEFDGGYVTTDVFDMDLFGGVPSTQNKFRRPVNGGERHVECTEITQESFYDWLRWKYPYVWADLTARVYGFNMNANLNELQDMIGFRHSSFRFNRGYTLEELGVDGFLTTKNVDSIEELVKVYQTNTEIHDNLIDLILNAETRDEKVVYQFVFDYLFTRNFDYDRYTLQSTGELASSYDEVLKERNYILWKYYYTLTQESDKETRQDMIRQAMNDIINTLEYYLNFDCLKYIFSIFTVSSFTSILRYIYLMINFFRSFKVYFLDSYVTFLSDQKLENTVFQKDGIGEIKLCYWKKNRLFQRDNAQITSILNPSDRYTEDNQMEILEVYGHYEGDPLFDNDIKGGKVSDGWNFLDLDGGPAEEQVYVLNINGKGANVTEKHLSFGYGYEIFGGTPETEVALDDHTHDPGTDLDNGPIMEIMGGGVEFTSYIPYIMLNGGREGAGRFMHDVDGAGPWDMQEYLDIDGKSVKSKSASNQPFAYGYDLDGGHPGYNEFVTPSMVVRVVDRQTLTADVRLVSSYRGVKNAIEEKDDGLYIEDKYANMSDWLAITEDMNETIASYQSYYNEAIDRIIISNDIDAAKQRVFKITEDYLKDAVDNLNYLNNLLEINKVYTDKKAQELEDQFTDYNESLSLLGWDEF